MNIQDSRGLRSAAGAALDRAPIAKKLVLIWAGASAALALVVSLLTLALESQIEGTGGLSGMGMRSALTTAQSFLTMFQSLALPFWTLGFTYAMLRVARGDAPGTQSLLEGFRRFGPMLRLLVLEGLLFAGLATVCIYAGVLLLSMTPLSDPVYQILEPVMNTILQDPNQTLDPQLLDALTQAMKPILICCLGLYAILAVAAGFRLRLAQLRLLEDDRCGALRAMGESVRLTRGNCLHLLKLDLSFWWYYLGQALIAVICYADLLLPMLGYPLPVDSQVAFWLCYVVSLALQLGLYWAAKARISVTYALAYDAIRAQRATALNPHA